MRPVRKTTHALRGLAASLFLLGGPALASAATSQGAIPTIRVPGAAFQPRPGAARRVARMQELVRASARLTEAERHDLGPLSSTERARLAAPDRALGERVKIGIARALARPVVLSGAPQALAPGTERSDSGGLAKRDVDGRLSWTTAFSSPGAAALRLYISGVRLPAGSRVFVYTERGQVEGPYKFDGGLPSGGFWTHRTEGDTVYLEVEISNSEGPAPPCGLTVSKIAHLAMVAALATSQPAQNTSCFVDATCETTSDFPAIDSASRAVAALEFADQGIFYLCSGGLIAAVGDSSTPYLLTANHCFDNQDSATSLQAFFNFRNTSCNAQPYPDESTFPSTLGSTLLATGATTDFTLVRLSQDPPAGAFLLGWTTQDVSGSTGTQAYRLSHPAPSGISWPQYYTRQAVQGSPFGTCSGDPVGTFIYSTQNVGGTTGGSSGSLLLLADGSIVGQLLGKCGTDTTNDCDSASNYLLDGAFRMTYPSVAPWLNPQTGPCTASATALCLSGGRFRVTADWQTATSSGSGQAMTLTADTGYFWFFSSTNVELVVKVLDACSLNNRFWFFAGGLTNVAVTVTVTDTQTGTVRTYLNPQSTAFQPVQDTNAFSTCP
jgi:lysyl endopeptidase